MRREKSQHAAPGTHPGADSREPGEPSALGQALEVLALLCLLLIIAMRPLMSETYDSSLHPIEQAAGMMGAATPTTTAALDLVILLCCLATAVSLAIQRRCWQWTRLEIGWMLMLAGAIVSTAYASNKRLAANASADWLITSLLVLILPNLCRNRWRIGLVLIVVIASGLVSLAKDGMQLGFEHPETRAMYFEDKAKFWARQNVPLDDPQVEMFERRIRGTAATGFFPHSNAQAALLSLAGFAALAFAGLGWNTPLVRTASIVLGLVLLASTTLAASKGGVLAAVIGLALLTLAWRYLPAVRKRWRYTVVAIVLGGAAVLFSVAAYGCLRGRLPGSSLQFRWEYWQVTSRIIGEHFWAGVGALNFDRAYLLYKPIQFPEEIKDPHNFLLSVLAQWGIVGLIGLLWLMCAGAYRSFARLSQTDVLIHTASSLRRTLGWSATLIVGFLAFRFMVLQDYWNSPDPGGRAMTLFDLELYGLLWSICLAGLVWFAYQARATPAAPARMHLALVCGTLAFLLHNLIEFALFCPGTLTPFAALAGVLMASEGDSPMTTNRVRRFAPPLGVVVLLLLFCRVVWIPVTRAGKYVSEARTTEHSSHADFSYRAAAEADAWDPAVTKEWAELLIRLGQPAEAIHALGQSVRRDPADQGMRRMLARGFEHQFKQTRDPAALRSAIDAARTAVRLYPASPDDHAGLAELLTYAAGELWSPSLAAEAVREFQTALDLDAARPGTDEVRRWSPQRRAELTKHLQKAHTLNSQPATAPVSSAS